MHMRVCNWRKFMIAIIIVYLLFEIEYIAFNTNIMIIAVQFNTFYS